MAGAIAFSLWEPITMAMMSGGGFDNYAWGIVLIGVFAISLLGLRVASDKIIPAKKHDKENNLFLLRTIYSYDYS